MAMNFWEAQRKARSWTALYLTVFILLTLIVATIAEISLRILAPENYAPPLPYFGAIFLIITFAVAGFEYSMYQTYGGSYVAKAVGARLVNPNSRDFREKQLLNIIEEMSVAASIPMPPVYIIDDAREINAFAAGLTPQNAAVTVTRGTLERLNRDELQGVIAHELGHIHNADMKISMRLAAMVMGFFFVLYIGLRILQFTPRSRDEKKGGNPIVLAAIILIVAGILTWFFGSILKAMVSREREYLADASAVQFTRNPQGIANALRKIADEEVHDMPKNGMAYSHLYFDDHSAFSALFATHPSIEKRIEAIEDRKYIPNEWNIPKDENK